MKQLFTQKAEITDGTVVEAFGQELVVPSIRVKHMSQFIAKKVASEKALEENDIELALKLFGEILSIALSVNYEFDMDEVFDSVDMAEFAFYVNEVCEPALFNQKKIQALVEKKKERFQSKNS